MYRPNHDSIRKIVLTSGARRLLWLCVAGLIASACATPGGRRAAPIETRQPDGFTIRESIRPGLGARSDFADALEAIEAANVHAAITLFEELAESAPDFAAVQINLGIAHRHANELEAAEAALRSALELNPRHPVAHNELGIVLRRQGRFAEARASYEAALARHPDFHFARRNLAIVCDLFLADPACALEHYTLYRAAVPDDEDVAMWIADLENRSGN